MRQRATAKSPPGQKQEPAPAPASPAPAAGKTDDSDVVTPEAPVSKGKTPSGQIFDLPQTHDVLSGLFDPRIRKSSFDTLILASFACQLALWATLPLATSRWLFLGYFAFWRLSYDVGLGCILTKQSKTRWIVRKVMENGWMDHQRHPKLQRWIQQQLESRMGKDYRYDAVPLEYNVWLAFRHLVDLILMNDFLAYSCFAWSWYTNPPQSSVAIHVLRWVIGWGLIYFNVIVKTDAHRVIKDYAWYWGDAFFLSLQNLVFDGVFELAPHPMYSAGYAGYYGLSLVVGSYTVFFASLAAHMCQFGFLTFFENPHIERTYGERVPLARRTPLSTSQSSANASSAEDVKEAVDTPEEDTADTDASTPSVTDATTDTETDELPDVPPPRQRRQRRSTTSIAGDKNFTQRETSFITQLTQHDLNNRYFQHEAVVFTGWDPLRSRDVGFGLAVFYAVAVSILPRLSARTQVVLHVAHAVAWRLFHSFGLGLCLKKQSDSKWMVRHFIKHYYYSNGLADEPVKEAFKNWIGIYNLSLIMTYLSFGLSAAQCYHWPSSSASLQSIAFRHVTGLLLVALHVWTATETFSVLGNFGWFYGDFFIEEYPRALYYTGIYRFLNNPERIMGGAAFLGMALVSGSKVIATLAICSIFAHLWFLQYVEKPHMMKLYGEAIRKTSGVRKSLSALVDQNVPESRPEIRRLVKSIAGLGEKMYDETAGSVDSFIKTSAPKFADFVNSKGTQLKQTRQNLTITRIGKVDGINTSLYALKTLRSLNGSFTPSNRFHLGEAIVMQWVAPQDHARSDWIGVYLESANKGKEVTKISSQGHWMGLYPEEWSGNEHMPDRPVLNRTKSNGVKETGLVTFEAARRLPPQTGIYEFRYHHAGKHNVLASFAPVEVYVEKPEDPNDIDDVYDTLLVLVRYALGNNVGLLPQSCTPHKVDETVEHVDPDNFMFDTHEQAKLLSTAIAASCDVELGSEVIIASANVLDLAQRVIEARAVLGLTTLSRL